MLTSPGESPCRHDLQQRLQALPWAFPQTGQTGLHMRNVLLLPPLLLLQNVAVPICASPTASAWTGPALRVVRSSGGFPALALGANNASLAPTFWLNIVNNVHFDGEAATAEEIVRAREAGVRVLSVCLSTAWVDGMPDWLNFTAVNRSVGTQSTFSLIAEHHPTAVRMVCVVCCVVCDVRCALDSTMNIPLRIGAKQSLSTSTGREHRDQLAKAAAKRNTPERSSTSKSPPLAPRRVIPFTPPVVATAAPSSALQSREWSPPSSPSSRLVSTALTALAWPPPPHFAGSTSEAVNPKGTVARYSSVPACSSQRHEERAMWPWTIVSAAAPRTRCKKTHEIILSFFELFSYVCPEPVLVK